MAWETDYYHYDGMGNTIALTNESETVTDTYTYDAFGNMVASTGSTPNPFRYKGKYGYYFDEQTEGYYVRARHLKTSLGRFISSDPIGYDGRINLYVYVGNSPTNWIDPSGLAPGDFGARDMFDGDPGSPEFHAARLDGAGNLAGISYVSWKTEIFGLTRTRFDWDVFDCSSRESLKSGASENVIPFQEFFIQHDGPFLALHAGFGLRGEWWQRYSKLEEMKAARALPRGDDRDAAMEAAGETMEQWFTRNDSYCKFGEMELALESREYDDIGFDIPALQNFHGRELQNVNRNYVRRKYTAIPYISDHDYVYHQNAPEEQEAMLEGVLRTQPAIWGEDATGRTVTQDVKIEWSRCAEKGENFWRITGTNHDGTVIHEKGQFPERE